MISTTEFALSVSVLIVGFTAMLSAKGTRWESFVRNFVLAFYAVLALLFAIQVHNEPWCPPPSAVDAQGVCR